MKNFEGEATIVAGTDSPSVLTPPHVLTSVRSQFPIFNAHPDLSYLDSAATGQKPQRVIDRLTRFYESENANIHRGVYSLSGEATASYDAARTTVARFINAASSPEVIFTRGTTEAINLVAQAWGRANVGAGDEIVVTEMEHHSNFVPWQVLAQERGARFLVAPITDAGDLDLEAMARLISPRTRLVALTHISNVLGTINPVRQVAEMAHAAGALVLVDAAQSVAHGGVNVGDLDCDFLAFSGHKLFGPTGIGVLYGRESILGAMQPWQVGGGMIGEVTVASTTWADLPARFEAGTPPIAGAVGLSEAIEFVEGLGGDAITAHEGELLDLAIDRLSSIPGVSVIGNPRQRASVISFTLAGVHPHDLGTVLDEHQVAIRAGHHCAQPLMRRLGLPATARASFSVYNTPDDVEALGRGVERARELFG